MTEPIYYGVWLKGQGWLKRNGEPFATEHKQIATETAQRAGGQVYFIDAVLKDCELYFLEMEASKVKGIRQLFEGWMKRLQGGK